MRVTDLPDLWERAAIATVGREEGAEAQRHTLLMCAKHLKDALSHDAGQEVETPKRGEATGDTTTFSGAWARLSPIDRAVITAYFERHFSPAVARGDVE